MRGYRNNWERNQLIFPQMQTFCDAFNTRPTVYVYMGVYFRVRSSKDGVSTFEGRCVDFRRAMCRPSKSDVSTFDDRCKIMLLYLLNTINIVEYGGRMEGAGQM